VEVARIPLTGHPVRVERGAAPEVPGADLLGIDLFGVDVAGRDVDGSPHTVVQVLLDDDASGFDRTLLDGLLVAEVLDGDTVRAREPFDHDAFRRRLHAEREAGERTTRGVLLLTGGELPPPWIRLAFLPVAIADTAGAVLVVRRTTPAELVAGVEEAHALGELTDDEHLSVLTVIDQHLPAG
jgi:hypothetical protein